MLRPSAIACRTIDVMACISDLRTLRTLPSDWRSGTRPVSQYAWKIRMQFSSVCMEAEDEGVARVPVVALEHRTRRQRRPRQGELWTGSDSHLFSFGLA